MQISDAAIRASRNLTKKQPKSRQKKPKKDKNQRPKNQTNPNQPKAKTALFRANKHLEKFIISNCRSV